MIQTIYSSSDFSWIDIFNPQDSDLKDIGGRYKIHSLLIEDILAPHHLPKFERTESLFFSIFRAVDENAPHDAYTVQSITRKIVFIWNDQFLITVRRSKQPFLDSFIESWQKKNDITSKVSPENILSSIFLAILETYEPILNLADTFIEETESLIFQSKQSLAVVEKLYTFRSRINAIRRILRMTMDSLHKINTQYPFQSTVYNNLIEETDHLLAKSDELKEDSIQLVNMYLSISSHHSNEITKVLTLFSAFFLPVTFIAGIYGMNFEFMPELKQPWGYGFIWFIMVLVTVIIFSWFKRNKWI
ncbi:MAG: hypothetical protein LC115_08945 [Bacteroidia bacterium]|nr:hypothetical protein [Bacteroidia bacterium]